MAVFVPFLLSAGHFSSTMEHWLALGAVQSVSWLLARTERPAGSKKATKKTQKKPNNTRRRCSYETVALRILPPTPICVRYTHLHAPAMRGTWVVGLPRPTPQSSAQSQPSDETPISVLFSRSVESHGTESALLWNRSDSTDRREALSHGKQRRQSFPRSKVTIQLPFSMEWPNAQSPAFC